MFFDSWIENINRIAAIVWGSVNISSTDLCAIDRALLTTREKIDGKRRRRSGVGSAIRCSIPVHTFADWSDPAPGFFEVDMVERLPENEQKVLEENLAALKKQQFKFANLIRLGDGMLESILEDKAHPSHRPLIYQNGFFGNRARKKIRSQAQFKYTNGPLWLYPQMLEELLKYVKIGKLEAAYRELLKTVLEEAERNQRTEQK